MKPHHGARTHSPGRPHRKLTGHDQPLCRRVSLCSKGTRKQDLRALLANNLHREVCSLLQLNSENTASALVLIAGP
ncbi:hypothetical protein MTO96_044367 [Rhipicephalus appendiculatus]